MKKIFFSLALRLATRTIYTRKKKTENENGGKERKGTDTHYSEKIKISIRV